MSPLQLYHHLLIFALGTLAKGPESDDLQTHATPRTWNMSSSDFFSFSSP
jgi:hypothetical protein